jgi:hypothetical protein
MAQAMADLPARNARIPGHMPRFEFVTVGLVTHRAFGGNPLRRGGLRMKLGARSAGAACRCSTAISSGESACDDRQG